MRCPHFLFAMLLVPTLVVAQERSSFHWMREIDLPTITATISVAVTLDSHFFQYTRPNWPDMRLSNDKGESVAYVVRTATVAKSRSVRRFWPAEQNVAKVDESVGLQVELTLRDNDPVPKGLRIVTPLRDFKHRIEVESSADGANWESAGPSTVIFDYSRHVDARNDLVPLQKTDSRRYRITIADLTAEQDSQLLELHRRLQGGEETERTERTTIARRAFRIDRIEFYRDDSHAEGSESRTTISPSNDFAATEDGKKHQTIITFASRREPITQVKIITEAQNFSRSATVEVEVEDDNGKTNWHPLSTGTLTRFAVGTIRREDLTLTIAERRQSHYRIVIENRDSPPLSISNVEVSGPIYELTFLALPGSQVKLEYGSPDAPAGQYDTAALKAALSQGDVTTSATLKAPLENPTAPQGRRWTPWNDTRILIGGIIALTLVLAWGLVRAGKQINEKA